MDSGANSSSGMQMQSSTTTAGDDECDSRAAATIFNNRQLVQPPPPQSHNTFIPPPPQHHHHDHHNTNNHLFHPPSSNYLLNNPSPNHDNDFMWSKLPNYPTDLGGFMGPSSSSQSPHNQGVVPFPGGGANNNDQTRTTPPLTTTTTTTTTTNTNAARNPKKRSRASRREPTTVLTTDTSNFRAMVQEFTGIPAPPFTSSSLFPRNRFDLFSTRSNTTTTSPTTLLRPFAQKLPHHPNFPLSSFSNNLTNSTTDSTASINHHQLPSFSADQYLGLLKQQPLDYYNVFNTQNPDQTMKYNNSSSSALEIPPSGADSSHLKIGVFGELGLLRPHHEERDGAASTEWAQRIASGAVTNNDCDGAHHAASNSSEAPECGVSAARSQGTVVEPWINSSSSDHN